MDPSYASPLSSHSTRHHSQLGQTILSLIPEGPRPSMKKQRGTAERSHSGREKGKMQCWRSTCSARPGHGTPTIP